MSASVVAAVSAVVIAGIMPRPVIAAAAAVVIVGVIGVVSGRVVAAARCGLRAAAVIVGVVPGRVIGAVAEFLLSPAVVVGVVPGQDVGAMGSGSRTAAVVVSLVPCRVVVPTAHHVNFRRVIVPVVMMDALGQAADCGKRHAPFQGLQREMPVIPSLMRTHGLASG